jgi:hypothetical protein
MLRVHLYAAVLQTESSGDGGCSVRDDYPQSPTFPEEARFGKAQFNEANKNMKKSV